MSRPEKEIDWVIVEKRMESGSSAKEICGALRIDTDTFYRRFKKKFGKSFGDFAAHYYAAGDANLRFTQYMKALSGNNTMLLLLGRERLGQGKEPEKAAPYDSLIELKHENMMLKAELEEIKEILSAKGFGVCDELKAKQEFSRVEEKI